MFKQACVCCKVVGVFAIVGALNWGSIGLFNVNFVENLFGQSTIAKVIYVLVGFSGLALLASYFTVCPKCRK